MNTPRNRKQTLEEFKGMIMGILQDIKGDLPKIAGDFYNIKGRGTICLHFTDSEEPKNRRMGIDYLVGDDIPDHRYLKQVVNEYDPATQAVVFATTEKKLIQMVRVIDLESDTREFSSEG